MGILAWQDTPRPARRQTQHTRGLPIDGLITEAPIEVKEWDAEVL